MKTIIKTYKGTNRTIIKYDGFVAPPTVGAYVVVEGDHGHLRGRVIDVNTTYGSDYIYHVTVLEP